MKVYFLLACLLAVLGAGPVKAQQAAATATAVMVPDLGDAELNQWIGKSNAYVGLLNTSLRAQESWARYLSWVNPKTGPTGRERIIYGLYSVSADSARRAIERARKAADEAPAIPALDDAAREAASAFEALFPILNEAEAYYDRKDYSDDKMAGGKALHAKLTPAAEAFIAARAKLQTLRDQLKAGLDTQELARLERTEGKKLKWHSRRTVILASKAVDLMPRDARRPGDLKAFDAAIVAFAASVRDFDTFVREEGKSSAFDSFPRNILGKLREIRDNFQKRRVNPTFYSMDFNQVISQYNMMINMADTFSR